MKKIFCFALSAILVVALILSSMAFASAAVVVTDEAGLLEALNGDAEEIQISGTVSLSEELIITRAVKITGGTIKGKIRVHTDATKTVTFKDVALSNGGTPLTARGASHIVLDGAALTSSSEEALYTNWNDTTSPTLVFTGIIDIIGGTTIERTSSGNVVNDGIGTAGTINFKSGTIKGNGGDSFKLQGGITINIGGLSGETANLNITGDGIWFTGSSSAVINVYDGANIVSANLGCNMNSTGNPTYNVYGGSITTSNNLFYTQKTANINIMGGTLNGGSNKLCYAKNNDNATKMTVSGGNITCSADTPFDLGSAANAEIKGGTFNFNPTAYVDADKCTITETAGKWTVTENQQGGAATNVDVSTEAELIEAINDEEKQITLTADIALTSALTLDFDTTIKGNGYSFSGQQIVVSGNGANVTLKDVKLTKGGDVLKVDGSPNLTIDGGEFKTTATSGNNGALYITAAFAGKIDVIGGTYLGGTRYALYNGTGTANLDGVVNLKNCTLENTSGGDVIKLQTGHVINVGNGDSGETVKIKSTNGDLMWWSNGSCITNVNIYDGASFEGGRPLAIGSTNADNKPVINIYGGTFNPGTNAAIYIDNGATVNVTGGTFNGVAEKPLIYFNDSRGTMNINGGTFNANATGTGFEKGTGTLVITSGTFNFDPTDYVDTTAYTVTENSGSWTVAATSGGGEEPGGGEEGNKTHEVDSFEALKTAAADAKDGDIINITGTWTATERVVIKADVTITGDGTVTWTSNQGLYFDTSTSVINAPALTLKLDPSVGASNDKYIIGLDKTDSDVSNLTIEAGTFYGYIHTQAGQDANTRNTITINDGIFYQQGHQIVTGWKSNITTTINGGTFIGDDSGQPIIWCNDPGAKVYVYGGNFTKSGSSDNSNILYLRNSTEIVIGKKGEAGPTMAYTGSKHMIKLGGKVESGSITFNSGTFTHSGSSGYAFDLDQGSEVPITINGGTWEIKGHDSSVIRVNDGGIKNFTINGGTFIQNSKGEPVILKNNGKLTVTGGTFKHKGDCAIIQTGSSHNNGKLIIDGTANPDAIVIEHTGTGAFIQYRAQSGLEINNINLSLVGEGSVLDITETATKDITITKSTLAASKTALNIVDAEKTDDSSKTSLESSKITSYFATAVVNPKGWIINYKDSSAVNNALGSHEHTPEWVYDDDYHWQRCTNEFCGAIVGEKMEHTGGTGDCHTQRVCSHPNCGQPYGSNNYDIHVNPDGPFVYKENADGTTHTKYYSCCNTKAESKEAHSFDENGYCKDCNAYQAYAFKTVEDTKQVIDEGQEITFTSVAEFSKFVAVRVDGKTLVKDTDYIVVSGSTKVTLKPEFIKTLTVGVHKLEIISTDGTATTTFGIEVAGSEDNIELPEEASKPGSAAKPDAGATDSNDAGTNGSGANDGTGGSNNVGTSDKTGNMNNLMLILALFVVSVIGITGYVVCNKKSESENN